MKKLIKSRKGVAIELAVGVMFLMIAFTIMLMSAAGLQNSLRVQDYQSFNEMIEVNDVGEFVISRTNLINGENNEITYPQNGENNKKYIVKYTMMTVADPETVTQTYEIYSGEVTDTQTATPILTIVVTNGEITSWK